MIKIVSGQSPGHDEDFPSDPLGEPGRRLNRLDRAGVPVLDTIVLDANVFGQFRRTGVLDAAVVECVLFAMQTPAFGRAEAVSLRPSTQREYAGLPETHDADAHLDGLQHGIERIYRAWSDEKCLASRSANSAEGADGWPAIIIQPKVSPVYAIVSRSALTGRRVGPADDYNVGIRVEAIRQPYVDLAARAEAALRMPCRIQFADEGGRLAVIAAEPQVMPDQSRDAALSEMLAAGQIDELDFLLGFKIEDLFEYSNFFEDGYSEGEYVDGIAASPGLVRAQLGFEDTPLAEFERRPILLAVREEYPELQPRLRLARAALGTSGGRASRLAVRCRSLGKPCVVGAGDLTIDRARCHLHYRDRVIPEFAEMILNGTSGRVFLTGDVRAGHRVKREHAKLVRRLTDIAARVAGSERVSGLDQPSQMRFAEAVEALRWVGAI